MGLAGNGAECHHQSMASSPVPLSVHLLQAQNPPWQSCLPPAGLCEGGRCLPCLYPSPPATKDAVSLLIHFRSLVLLFCLSLWELIHSPTHSKNIYFASTVCQALGRQG